MPHLADTEVLSALRGLVTSGNVSPDRANQALQDLGSLPARRWPAKELSERVWELRHSMTAYDATYIALAEALGADLLTCDARLARAAAGVARCAVRIPH